MSGFHLPLLDYALHSLKQGRFPLWDPTIYCGASFVANTQAALFYPPTWLLLAVNAGREHVTLWSVEAMAAAHAALAFALFYGWLRRRLAPLACALAALGFACGGQMMMQFSHLGEVIAYSWMPLGFWGIDQAVEERRWRPLWRLALASAMIFMGGYPPVWPAFGVGIVVYALIAGWRSRVALWTLAALAISLLLSMIQLLPALEAARLKVSELKYGAFADSGMFVRYFLPSPADLRMGMPLLPDGLYLYLGAPVIFGIGWLAWRRRCRACLPALSALAATFWIVVDPGSLLWHGVIRHNALLSDLVRSFYFQGMASLMIAALAAHGLDAFLSSPRPGLARRAQFLLGVGMAVTILLAAWAVWLIRQWSGGAATFVNGGASFAYAAVFIALCGPALLVAGTASGRRLRLLTGAALLVAAIAEYKAFGTCRQFNAQTGDFYAFMFADKFRGIDDKVYQEMLGHPGSRVVFDMVLANLPNGLRHYGLSTPQGFDPLRTAAYHHLLRDYVYRQDPRLFDFPPDPELLRLLGVRYYITSEQGRYFRTLAADPAFRKLEPAESYFKVYELRDAAPAYRWVPQADSRSGEAVPAIWHPERREVLVESPSGGRMALIEQSYPGWEADIDGRPAAIEPWQTAFQSVSVPPGRHRVRFRYRPWTLPAGAVVSLATLLALSWLLWTARRPADGVV
jgi:hypothetical protein